MGLHVIVVVAREALVSVSLTGGTVIGARVASPEVAVLDVCQIGRTS